MRAMILAAGRGERMRPLTDSLPKPLLSVGGRALIEHHLIRLATAGVRQVVINHAWLGELIEQKLGDGSRYGVQIQYSPEGASALETAGGIKQALPRLGNDPFLVINGDILTDYPFEHLPTLADTELAHIVLVPNPVQHPQGDFALEQGLAQETGSLRYTFSGIGVYRPALFESLTPGPARLAPLLRQAMVRRQIAASVYRGRWDDIGTPERLAAADLAWQQDTNYVG